MAVAPAIWTFVLTDLAGVSLGEVTNADERNIVLPLNRLPTAQFKIPLGHSLANTVLTQDCLLKAYRWNGITATRTLMFNGPVITAEEQGDRDVQSIMVNAAGPFWRLTKRLIGTSKAGIQFGTAANPVEITAIAKSIVDTVNGATDGYTGIAVTEQTPNTPANMTKIGPMNLRVAGELIAELAASVNAFDYDVVPIEPVFQGFPWPTIGNMRIIPYIGTSKPDAIFEYGTGQANVVGYTRTVGRESIMNKGYITSPGWPDGTARDLVISSDASSITTRGLFEDQLTDGGVADDTVRGAILSEHLYYRAKPREIINITLAPNARPWINDDWVVGDSVRVRAVVNSTVRFDAMFRIWGVTFSVDKNGNESTTLELVMP